MVTAITVQCQVIHWHQNGNIVAGTTTQGSAANELAYPKGIFVDKNKTIYISDAGNYRVQKWVYRSTSGVTVAGGNGIGNRLSQFRSLQGVFVDDTGNIYACDQGNSWILKWKPGDTSGSIIAGNYMLGHGSGSQQLDAPIYVFVNQVGDIYVADFGNNRVQKWVHGVDSGITVAGGNGAGNAANQLYQPSGIAFDTASNMYVADAYNNRVQKWAPGASSGVTVAGTGVAGNAPNQLNKPNFLFIDDTGNLYIADMGNQRLQKWPHNATSGITVCYPYIGNIFIDDSNYLYGSDWDRIIYKYADSIPLAVPAINMLISDWALYPNPNSGTFTISGTLDGGSGTLPFSIVDNRGKIIFEDKIYLKNGKVRRYTSIDNYSTILT